MCILTRNGFVVDCSELEPKVLNSVKRKLTITYVNKIGKRINSKQMYLYRTIRAPDNSILFVVSRFSGIKLLLEKFANIHVKYINTLTPGIDITQKIVCDENGDYSDVGRIDLEPHQQLCLDYMMDNVYAPEYAQVGSASCIFVMDTGLGKTFIAAALIEKLKVKTLVIIPNLSNINGWHQPFKLYLNNLKVGEYHANKKVDGDVVIMTIDSALSDTFSIKRENDVSVDIKYYDYFKEFGLIIYDEIHNYPTEVYQNIFWRANLYYGLGLTATPDERLDHMDEIYHRHVGKLVIAKDVPGFNNYAQDLKWCGKVYAIRYYGSPDYTHRITNSLGLTDVVSMQKQFSSDPYRIQLLQQLIMKKLNEKRYIYVFAVHRDILETLYNIIKAKVDNNACVRFMGGHTSEEYTIAMNDAQIVFTTYSFGKESISIVRMNTIIFAQPMRNKMRQTLGRILRRGGDPSIEREIIDIIDMNTRLKSQFNTRKLIYFEKQFPIYEEHITYEESLIE